MKTKIQKWGNSQGLRISKEVLEVAGFNIGTEVEIKSVLGKLVIQNPSPVRGKYRIEDLAARMPKDYQTVEDSWGHPEGNEVW
jgi:antitoxin MazE